MSASAAMPAPVEYGVTHVSPYYSAGLGPTIPQEPTTGHNPATQPQSVTYQQTGPVTYATQVSYATPQVTYAAPTIHAGQADVSAPHVTYGVPTVTEYSHPAQDTDPSQPVNYASPTTVYSAAPPTYAPPQTAYASPTTLAGVGQAVHSAAPVTYAAPQATGQAVYAAPAVTYAAPTTVGAGQQIYSAAPQVTYAQATGPQQAYTAAESINLQAAPAMGHSEQLVYQTANPQPQQVMYQMPEQTQPVSYFQLGAQTSQVASQTADQAPLVHQDQLHSGTPVHQTAEQAQLAPHQQVVYQTAGQVHAPFQHHSSPQTVQYVAPPQSISYAPTYHVPGAGFEAQPHSIIYAPTYQMPGAASEVAAGNYQHFAVNQPGLTTPMEPSAVHTSVDPAQGGLPRAMNYTMPQIPGYGPQFVPGQPPLFPGFPTMAPGYFPMTVNPDMGQSLVEQRLENEPGPEAGGAFAGQGSKPARPTAGKQYKVSKKKKSSCC